jgi:hypothetical protein
MPDPKKVHEREQTRAAMEECARDAALYFKALRAEGVPAKHAEGITSMFSIMLLQERGIISRPPEPGFDP